MSFKQQDFLVGRRYRLYSIYWRADEWVEGVYEKITLYNGDEFMLLTNIVSNPPAPTIKTFEMKIDSILRVEDVTPITAFPMGNVNFQNIKRFTPDLSHSSDGVVNLTTNKKKCTCEMRTLSMNGCQCGAHEAEMKAKYGKDWTKPHWR